MSEVLLFHHVLGQTNGFRAFSDRLREAGHSVHTPDLFDGRTFTSIDDGLAYVETIGFPTVLDRGVASADDLPTGLVYAGFSLGVVPAQCLAQTRPGAAGALLFHSCLPVGEFGDAWPSDVPVQIHAMEHDPFFVDDGDIDAARALVSMNAHAELFLYPGEQHLFAETGHPSYDEVAATLLVQRVLTFLGDR